MMSHSYDVHLFVCEWKQLSVDLGWTFWAASLWDADELLSMICLYLDMSWSALSDRLLSLRKFCAGSLWDRMMWLGWHGGSHRKASHLHADDGGFASRSRCGSITSCSHPCASVTEQYNLVPAKDGDALWQASWNGSFSQLWVDRQGRWSIVAVPLTVLHVSILMVRNLLSLCVLTAIFQVDLG